MWLWVVEKSDAIHSKSQARKSLGCAEANLLELGKAKEQRVSRVVMVVGDGQAEGNFSYSFAYEERFRK